MVERLAASSGFGLVHRLGHHGAVRPAGVAVWERPELALASVLARRGSEAALAAKVAEAFNVALPATPRHARTGPIAFAWTGPGHWLAIVEKESGHRFEARLRSALGPLASISDQSDGKAVIRLAGPRARATLAKGLPVDLDPAAFQPGSALVSAIAHIGVHLWQVDDAPTYDIAVARSYAPSLWHWLAASAAEFGLTVAPG